MPLLLAINDPARIDGKTGAAVTYVRIDAFTLIDELRAPPRGVVRVGIYPDVTMADTRTAVAVREIVLTPNQAQVLADLVMDRIYTALSAPNGPFPNATIVA